MNLHQWLQSRSHTWHWSNWGWCVYYVPLIDCQDKSFWWKCCKEKTIGVIIWRTTNCEWVFFTQLFLVLLVWVVVCACVFCVSLAFSCKYIYACWVTLKVLLKGILDIKFYSFFSLLILDFLGRWTLNIGQNFCLQPSISTKTEFGLVLRVKLTTRWVVLEKSMLHILIFRLKRFELWYL